MNQNLKPLFEGETRVVDFFFDPKTGVIYFWKSIENKKVKFSTRVKLPDIAKARRVANRELRVRLSKRKIKVHLLIKDELELWLKVKEAEGHKESTLVNIRRAKKHLEQFWGDKFPHEIHRDNLALWYAWWAETYADIAMENSIKYLRNFCRYLAEKIIDGIPIIPTVPRIKDPNLKLQRSLRMKKKERIITADEFKAIRGKSPSEEAEVIVLLMYTMATRITETLTMRFGHEIILDLEYPVYRWSIGQNKADLTGEHVLHPVVVERLKALKLKRDAEGTLFLFPQLRNKQAPLKEQQIDWQAWRDVSKLGWQWTPHTFRHTCLSNLFNDARNPQALICKLYRVSIGIAMEHYIKPTEEGRLTLREAIKMDFEK